MNDSCTSIRQLLSEQFDRPLTAVESARLQHHLAACSDCRAVSRDLHAGLTGISRLPHVSGNPRVREAVLAQVHPGGHSGWPRGWRDWSGQTLKLAGAVTAFALVAVLLMNLFDSSGTGEPDDRFSGTGSQPEPTTEPAASPTVPVVDNLAPCHPDQVEYDLLVDALPGNPAGDSPPFVRIGLHAIKSTGGVTCRIDVPVSLTITGADGTPLDIQGNPVTGTLDANLGAGDARIEFAWMNWCGAQGPYTLSADILTSSDSESGVQQSTMIRPICEDETRPSTLGPSVNADSSTVVGPTDEICSSHGTTVTERDATTGAVRIWFALREQGNACESDDHVTVRLTDASGGLLDIEGNDTELTLAPDPLDTYTWVGVLWANWCGETDRLAVEFTQSSSGIGTGAQETPECVDPNQPSTLTVLTIPPPGDPFAEFKEVVPTNPDQLVDPPVCDLSTINLNLLPLRQPRLLIELSAKPTGNADTVFCLLDPGDLTVTITDANGTPLDIDGNGQTYSPRSNEPRVLNQSEPDGVIWENWCGNTGPFTVTATYAGHETTLELPNGPTCLDESLPSRLSRLGESGP